MFDYITCKRCGLVLNDDEVFNDLCIDCFIDINRDRFVDTYFYDKYNLNKNESI